MFRPTDLQSSGNDKGCMDTIKDYWAMVPLYNRFLLVFLPTLYAISWVIPIHLYAFNSLQTTIYDREGKILMLNYSLENIHSPIHAPPASNALLCASCVYSNSLY